MRNTFQEHVSLQEKHTFGLPWQSAFYVEVGTEDEVVAVVGEAHNRNLDMLVLGGGSNILPTKVFDGLVIKNNILGIRVVDEDDDFVTVQVGAGEDWHRFVCHAIENGWYGLENLSLIPGTVGGAAVQNIGAYDVDIARFVESVDAYHVRTAEKRSFSASGCTFEYRNSLFKKTDEWFVTSVTLRLPKTFSPVVTYKPLQNLSQRPDLSAQDVANEVIRIRESKLPNWHVVGTAGSFFGNPRISEQKADQLKQLHSDIPLFNNYGSDEITVPAGWLIEHSSLSTDLRAEFLYPKHALVVVNRYKGGSVPENHGQAIKEFIQNIQQIVANEFGIDLHPEVRIF